MRISPIINYINKPNFTSTKRTTYYSPKEGSFTIPSYQLFNDSPDDIKMVVSNMTNFFRRDFDWKNVGKIFDKQFPKGKVNIHDFACSDGSEAYSLVIALIEQLGKKEASRFFPIQASDVDSEIIRMAKSGKITADEEDLFQIGNYIKDADVKKYFSITPIGGERYILSPKKILTDNITFKCESIKDGLNGIEKDKNNIILARNFWRYLSREELTKTTWALKEKTNDDTLVVIGNFDCQFHRAPYFLEGLGFCKHSCDDLSQNILRKIFEICPEGTQDIDSWRRFINSRYSHYIPSYIK